MSKLTTLNWFPSHTMVSFTVALIFTIGIQCCLSASTRDLKIEVDSHLIPGAVQSGKLYVDDNQLTITCHVVSTGMGDSPAPGLHQVFGKTLTSIGQAPKLILYNDTWKETFPFPLDSWENSEGHWEMTIAREELGFTDEVHKPMVAEITLGDGMDKLAYATVVIDIHSDPLWNQQFGVFLGSSSLEDIMQSGEVKKQIVSQHPCTSDTVLLLIQLDTAVLLGVSLDKFLPAYSTWYNVTETICMQQSHAVCQDLMMVDVKVTNEYVLLLTSKGLFVGQLLTVESTGQNKQYHWAHIALPSNFDSSYKDLKLQYTSVCNSPTHAGDVQEDERVLLAGLSSTEVVPHVSLSPFTSWTPVMTHSVPTKSLAYDYQTNRYFVALQESAVSDIKIASYEANMAETNAGYTSVFKFPKVDDESFDIKGICIHPGTHHIYAYGSQLDKIVHIFRTIWVSSSSGIEFHHLVSPPANDTIISCSSSQHQGSVVFTSLHGDVYYGRAGVFYRLLYIPLSSDSVPSSKQQTFSTYIDFLGHVMHISTDGTTIYVDNLEIHGKKEIDIKPFDSPVAVQFLSKKRVVLFDILGHNSLSKAFIGLQLSHRFGGSMLIHKVLHIPSDVRNDKAVVTMVTGYLVESLVWESQHSVPAVQHDLNVESMNITTHWLRLPEGKDPASGWHNSDVGKTVTMAAASSILITQYHNSTHAIGNVILPQLSASLYPAGKWRVYNLKAFDGGESLWSMMEAECSHTLLPDEAAAQYPVRFLDVGDSFTFSVTAAVTKPGLYHVSKKQLLLLGLSNPSLFHTQTTYTRNKFGSETITVTLHHEIFNKGTSTVTVYMPDASMLCPHTSFTLTIKCACPPSKRLVFIYSPDIPDQEFLHGNPKNKRKKPLLVNLKPNYRPPSHLGIAIPLSDNVYNADPSKKRPRDYYQDSKDSGRYKHCQNKTSRDECGCTDALKLSSLQRDTDCRERAYSLQHPGKIWPRFIITEQDKADQWLEDPYVLTLREVNNRENHFVTDSPSASLTTLKEAGFKLANGSQLHSTRELKITLLGSELYHFQATVIEGFSYCPLQDEFQFYVRQPPLAYPTQMIIIASVSVGIGGAIIIIYLYYLSKHYIPPVRTVGSKCMDLHHH